MRGSRKLQVQSRIRASQHEHLSTYSMPFERTLEAVPYYARKHQQLRNRALRLSRIELGQEDDIGAMQITQSEATALPLARMIAGVSVEPLEGQSGLADWHPQDYPLAPEEELPVVDKHRYFPTQDYYRALWETKSKQEVRQIAEKARLKASEILQHHSRLQPSAQRHRDSIFAHSKLAGNPDHLAPVYEPFESRRQKPTPFAVREIDRERILSRAIGDLLQEDSVR